jgi:hypothetical protein
MPRDTLPEAPRRNQCAHGHRLLWIAVAHSPAMSASDSSIRHRWWRQGASSRSCRGQGHCRTNPAGEFVFGPDLDGNAVDLGETVER